jgi:hypothetical protein
VTSPAVWAPVAAAVTGGFITWASMIIRLMWQFRGKWDYSNAQLERMAEKISDLTVRDERLEQRLQSHLDWHMQKRNV